MLKIDAHQHFWKYDPRHYGWIGAQMGAIKRDFLPADLQKTIAGAGIDGVISVQARQALEETGWLLDLADQHAFIQAVVGWVPLINAGVERMLEMFASKPKLRGIRHVLHDEWDEGYMLREDFNRGVGALHSLGLAYDILIFERHLPQTIQFVDKHPNQIFVVNHLAKPRVKQREISPWRENLRELARRANVYCKLSGLVTEADYAVWSTEQLRPYIETVLDAFGPRRTMFGSDWPVCLLAIGYGDWARLVADFISELSASEQERFWSGTAMEAYGLRRD
ncbi:MAG: amidohydrolase family protein [Bryobacteraceae bacterium]